MPPKQQKRWTEAVVEANLEMAMDRLFDTLYKLRPATDEDGEPKPTELGLSDEGKRVWIQFYNEHAAAQREAVGNHAALLSKIEGVAARLALVIHLARLAANDCTLYDLDSIDAESIRNGVLLARWFAHEAQRVYGILAESEEDAELREAVEWIRRRGGAVTVRDLQRGLRRFRKDPSLAQRTLAELVKRKIGQWQATTPESGRPGLLFRLVTSGDGDTTAQYPGESDGSVATADAINTHLATAAMEADEDTQ
jgi:hypothetical protein